MKRIGVKSGTSHTDLYGPGTPGCIPSLDGTPAKLSGSVARCSLCGASGHSASAHAGGKAIVKAEPSMGDPEPSGEAITQDKATQFPASKPSPRTTGSLNYKPPGSEGGMS